MATAAITYPQSAQSPPLYGEALDDVFHDNIQGVTGMTNGSLIRPRWQPEPPNQPDFNVDWIAFGVNSLDGDRDAYLGHVPSGNGGLGETGFEKDEVLRLLLSFYGPGSTAMCKRYQDGLQIARNRDDLLVYNIKLVEVQEAIMVPVLLKEKWLRRVDITVMFRRRIFRSFAIPSIVGETGSLNNEQYSTPIIVP